MTEAAHSTEIIEVLPIGSSEPCFDPDLGQYVALTPGGVEVYGDTWNECLSAWTGHVEIETAHCAYCPLEPCDALVQAKCGGQVHESL